MLMSAPSMASMPSPTNQRLNRRFLTTLDCHTSSTAATWGSMERKNAGLRSPAPDFGVESDLVARWSLLLTRSAIRRAFLSLARVRTSRALVGCVRSPLRSRIARCPIRRLGTRFARVRLRRVGLGASLRVGRCVSANADVNPPTVSARVVTATVRIFAFWNLHSGTCDRHNVNSVNRIPER